MQQNRTYGRIAGWGTYAPERVVTNADLAAHIDTTHEWIVRRTGIHERHIASLGETTATMATEAGMAALAQANLDASELDLIIVATSTPDYLTPPVSSQIQHALGATDVPAFVLVTGCTGFIYALSIADQFIRSGVYKNILVIGAELLSRFVDWADRSTCVLFGDAAGAAVVQAWDQPSGVLGFTLGSDGSLSENIIFPECGLDQLVAANSVDLGSQYLKMNGREVFKFASRIVGPACDRALAEAGCTLDDIDWIVPHQANIRIIKAAAENMNVPLERFLVNIQRYGNTSAASIPLAIHENLQSGRVRPGDTLLLVAFGAGLTWAASVLKLARDK